MQAVVLEANALSWACGDQVEDGVQALVRIDAHLATVDVRRFDEVPASAPYQRISHVVAVESYRYAMRAGDLDAFLPKPVRRAREIHPKITHLIKHRENLLRRLVGQRVRMTGRNPSLHAVLARLGHDDRMRELVRTCTFSLIDVHIDESAGLRSQTKDEIDVVAGVVPVELGYSAYAIGPRLHPAADEIDHLRPLQQNTPPRVVLRVNGDLQVHERSHGLSSSYQSLYAVQAPNLVNDGVAPDRRGSAT